MRQYKNLQVWKKAIQLAIDCTKATLAFPHPFRYELGSHLRKTGTSMHSNIAEACGRKSSKDFARFLRIAMGSVMEFESQCMEAQEYGLIDDEFLKRATKLKWSINKLINTELAKKI